MFQTTCFPAGGIATEAPSNGVSVHNRVPDMTNGLYGAGIMSNGLVGATGATVGIPLTNTIPPIGYINPFVTQPTPGYGINPAAVYGNIQPGVIPGIGLNPFMTTPVTSFGMPVMQYGIPFGGGLNFAPTGILPTNIPATPIQTIYQTIIHPMTGTPCLVPCGTIPTTTPFGTIGTPVIPGPIGTTTTRINNIAPVPAVTGIYPTMVPPTTVPFNCTLPMNGLGIQNCCIPSVGAISPMNTAVPGFCPTSSWATPWNNLIPNHNPWLASPFGIAGIGNTLNPGIIPNLPFNTFSPAINTTPFLNTCLPSVWNNAVNPMWNTLAGVPGLGNVSPINAFGLGLNHCMPFGTTVPFIPGCN